MSNATLKVIGHLRMETPAAAARHETVAASNGAKLRAARFALITAGQRFLLKVLPFRAPESVEALATFADAARWCRPLMPDLDAVILRCLAAMNRHTGGRLPSLVDRYLSDDFGAGNCLANFSRCVEDVLRYQGIVDGRVQKAIAVITAEHCNENLSPPFVAAAVGVRLATLCTVFKQQTRLTLSQYIRNVRLDQASVLLATTSKSVKEVWTAVGYNHASNFDHDFRNRFGVTPREHRGRTIQPLAEAVTESDTLPPAEERRAEASDRKHNVLIIDDEEDIAAMIADHLRRLGHSATTAASGDEGVREFERVRPDLILLDYQLPDMTGLECLKAIRRRPGGNRPGVALFTADWTVFDLEEELRALGSTIILKPCDLPQIVSRLTAMLDPAGGLAGRP